MPSHAHVEWPLNAPAAIRIAPSVAQLGRESVNRILAVDLLKGLYRGPGAKVADEIRELPFHHHIDRGDSNRLERERKRTVTTLENRALGWPIGPHAARIEVVDLCIDSRSDAAQVVTSHGNGHCVTTQVIA